MKGRARSVTRTARTVVGKCQPGKGRQKTLACVESRGSGDPPEHHAACAWAERLVCQCEPQPCLEEPSTMRWMTIGGGKKRCVVVRAARLTQHDVIGGDAANGSVPPTTSHPIPAAYFTQSSDDKSIHILPLLLTVVLNIEFLQFQRN